MSANEVTWNQETKDKWVAIMREHQSADRFDQGSWLGFKDEDGFFTGCFFGCAMQSDDSPLELAIKDMELPPWLIYLAEKIFEGLPSNESLTFPVRLIESIPVDACIESIKYGLAVIRLSKLLNEDNPSEVNSAINLVIDCHKRNEITSTEEWSAAESAARSAWSAESAALISLLLSYKNA